MPDQLRNVRDHSVELHLPDRVVVLDASQSLEIDRASGQVEELVRRGLLELREPGRDRRDPGPPRTEEPPPDQPQPDHSQPDESSGDPPARARLRRTRPRPRLR